MSEWIDVKDRLPDFDVTVLVCFPSSYDGKPVYAWGARVDDLQGWAWGVGGRFGVRADKDAVYNEIEVSDEYPVAYWMPLPPPPKSTSNK